MFTRGTVGPRLGGARLPTARHQPGDQLGHGVTAGMVGAQTLREEHPDRDGRRVNPTLPEPSCLAEGLVDMIFRQQTGEIKLAMTTRLGHRLSKRNIHLRPPCLAVVVCKYNKRKEGRFCR